MRTTIKKIAELAKVSRGTVDRVLHDRPGVKEDIRKKVKNIAEALDYKPNLIAKSLVNLKNPVRIGAIIAPVYNPFVDEIKRGVEAASHDLHDYGLKTDIQPMKNFDVEEQIGILNKFIKDRVSGIMMVPIENYQIREYINKAVDSGIPVVTFNSDIKGTNRLCFVGQDHLMGGRVAGDLMAKVLNGEGKVAIITSSLKLLCHIQRIEGFNSVLFEEGKNIEVIGTFENEDLDSKAFEQVLSLCDRVPDLKGIYITGGGTSGLGKALKILGLEKKIRIISHDLVESTVDLVKKKVIDFTIGQNPYQQGYLPVKILFDYIMKGKLPEADFIKINIDIRTEINIDL